MVANTGQVVRQLRRLRDGVSYAIHERRRVTPVLLLDDQLRWISASVDEAVIHAINEEVISEW